MIEQSTGHVQVVFFVVVLKQITSCLACMVCFICVYILRPMDSFTSNYAKVFHGFISKYEHTNNTDIPYLLCFLLGERLVERERECPLRR